MIECTIGGLLERAAQAYGPRTAIVAGDRRISYAQTIVEVRQAGRALLCAGLRPGDLFGIYYTGGTTGRPKGVAHTHRTFSAALFSEMLELGLGEADVFAHCAPLTHASGAFVLPVWMRGGTNLVLGGFDPDGLLAAIAKERVTATLLVPTMIYVLLDHPAVN